jgi:hypothetical protein
MRNQQLSVMHASAAASPHRGWEERLFQKRGARPTGFSHVRRFGGIRAQPDPRAHPSGFCRRAAPWPHRRPSAETHRRHIEAAQAMLAHPDIADTQIAQRLDVSQAQSLRPLRHRSTGGRQIYPNRHHPPPRPTRTLDRLCWKDREHRPRSGASPARSPFASSRRCRSAYNGARLYPPDFICH